LRLQVTGLHSSWVTEQILAMARPWQVNLEAGAAAQLRDLNVGMVLNLQEMGEHAHCGPGNLSSTGFSYDPETIMQAGIGFYLMSWPDMATPRLDWIIKIVQVMHHVCEVQRLRVAVHCHAGLGRTGLAIACYLVYSGGYSPKAAVEKTREGRPGALQTSAQVIFVYVFECWLRELRCIGRNTTSMTALSQPLWDSDSVMLLRVSQQHVASFIPSAPSSLSDIVKRQKQRLHGPAIRHYWNVPELLVCILQVLIHLIHSPFMTTASSYAFLQH
jgi:hypothetical protein